MLDTTIKIEGMECENCLNAVTNALIALPSVTSTMVDLKAGTATISHLEPLDENAVSTAIDKAGFDYVGMAA